MKTLTQRLEKLEATRQPGGVFVYTEELTEPGVFTNPEGQRFTEPEIEANHKGKNDHIFYVMWTRTEPKK
jgi:hypothetical protein